jgi:addiction module HigA family antidote
MAAKRLEPIHPGEILEEEFMRPLGLSANSLARRIDVPVTRISEIVRGKRGITADTALRLGRLFGTSSELWLGLQSEYDLRVARRESASAIQTRITPLKRSNTRYPSSSEGARSNVSEQSEPYGAGRVGPLPRDRRRIRRSSLSHGPKPDQKLFLALIHRLARSSDAAEQKRLKEELARLIYAG